MTTPPIDVTPKIPPRIPPPNYLTGAQELLKCMCRYVAVNGAGELCWCGFWPGAAVAWDHCAECGNDVCGMGWIRLTTLFPYDEFPQQTISLNCRRPLAYGLEIGVLRCLPAPGPDGEAPDEVAMGASAQDQWTDAWAMYQAIECCDFVENYAIQNYTPLGPAGGCVGGQWTVWLDAV